MNLSSYVGQTATINSGAGMLGNAVGLGSIGVNTAGSQYMNPAWDEKHHQFNCYKVENGWTLNYRNKNYIAATLEELMDQMKAAMVTERMEK